jgi:hypothetical protein
MTRRAAVVVLAIALGAVRATAAPALEVHARRGIEGVVPSGGIDLVEIELRSASDVALSGDVVVGGRAHHVDVPARGSTIVTLGQRVPAGASMLPAAPIVVRTPKGDVAAEIPVARVVLRPVVVLTDDPIAVLPRVDEWRRAEQLGISVAVSPSAAPVRWQSLAGAGALVLDRPLAALAPAVARGVTRYLGTGGRVCRVGADRAIACTHPPSVGAPQSPHGARIAPLLRDLGLAALAVTALLAIAAGVYRRRRSWALAIAGIAIGGGAIVPLATSSHRPPAIEGVIAAVDNREDWVAGAVGVADDGEAVELAGDLWIEPFSGTQRLDDTGLGGRIPGSGTWLVRGYVPVGARWTKSLVRVGRALPEAP